MVSKFERIRKGILLFFTNRSIQDLSDHGASKEPKNPLWSGFFKACFEMFSQFIRNKEIIKVREWIPHIGPQAKVIPLKLFLDIVPSSSEDVTRAMRGEPNRLSRNYPRGVGTPYNGLYGEAPPERGTFFRLQVYKRVGISQVEVYKRVGKSVI